MLKWYSNYITLARQRVYANVTLYYTTTSSFLLDTSRCYVSRWILHNKNNWGSNLWKKKVRGLNLLNDNNKKSQSVIKLKYFKLVKKESIKWFL